MQPDEPILRPEPRESVIELRCQGALLPAIVSLPVQSEQDLGVVVIVGGPQYRVGSHRQFVQLARHLAREGFATLRFDYRGMGDAPGEVLAFDAAREDVRAAVDALRRSVPSVRRVVLWGLCDAASAALMHGTDHADVVGVVLVNPWVRSEATLAAATVKHYYRGRLMQREFWLKMVSGRFDWRASLRSFGANLRATRGAISTPAATGGDYRDTMARGWSCLRGPSLLILSGDDLTAREFTEYTSAQPSWQKLLARTDVRRVELPDADHTFSRREWKAQVERETSRWLHEALCPA